MFTNISSSSNHGILDQCMSRPLLMIDSTKWPCNNVVELAPNCPRCASSNTKFCYYNNYSLSQPRYFCKGCRRYWTKGGSLRNVPVGGGCRKSRRARRHTGPDHAGPAHDPTTASAVSGEIDMAAVYAKYVHSNNEESYIPGDGSGSSSYNVQTSGSSEIGDHSPSEDCNNAVTAVFDQYNGNENSLDSMVMMADIFVDQDMNGAVTPQDDGFTMMMNEDSNVFELLADDDHQLGFDALWSSSGTELQDFGVFSENNDQFGGMSTNNNHLLCDNWVGSGSIDISSHEIFSRSLNFD